jgi:formylglycine-generating enzyme required for sulfatase activity
MVAMLAAVSANAADYTAIPAGSLVSVISNPDGNDPVRIEGFKLRVTPVTNGEFSAFVNAHQEWRRGNVPSVFADSSYLHRWASPTLIGGGLNEHQPVTSVSWFVAQAFCESEDARLPTWYEWEYVAAADETHADARSDPIWRAHILSWYAQNSDLPASSVGRVANYYGIRDMHGLIWEWVDDFNALFISADSRNQGDPDKLKFCGAGAISLQDKENFAILMRIALLSSLEGADTTNNLGFRCARGGKKE